MNEHEKQRIADAVTRLRPDWPAKQIVTLLGNPFLADRPRRDVAVALTWVACESGTGSPYRVLEAGPWWQAAAIEGRTTAREPFDRSGFCGTCSEPEQRCRTKWATDHEFVPFGQAIAPSADTSNHAQRIRAGLRGIEEEA